MTKLFTGQPSPEQNIIIECSDMASLYQLLLAVGTMSR